AQSSQWPPGGRVIGTRIGNAAVGGYSDDGMRRFIVDFAGGDLDGLDARQPVKAHVAGTGAAIDAVTVERLPDTGMWRLAFRAQSDSGDPVDLRGHLSLYGESLTETWTYLWTP